ncbi:MAG: hypothetical protein F4Z73_04430 [Synechococcus sp. SB0668_bin_13]|nr:hypothetical protein [Synechococcus sp. SB0668_bin_13]
MAAQGRTPPAPPASGFPLTALAPPPWWAAAGVAGLERGGSPEASARPGGGHGLPPPRRWWLRQTPWPTAGPPPRNWPPPPAPPARHEQAVPAKSFWWSWRSRDGPQDGSILLTSAHHWPRRSREVERTGRGAGMVEGDVS